MDPGYIDQAQQLRERVRAASPTRIITVASGKGGVGKSCLTVNLAIALGRMGRKVLVVDADFGPAGIHVMLGAAAEYTLSHYLRGERGLSQIIQEGYDGVQFISGGSGVHELLAMNEKDLRAIIGEILEDCGKSDVILFDTGAGIDDDLMQMVSVSTEAVLITTPEPTSIIDTYALVKRITRQGHVPPIRILLNKGESMEESRRAMEGLQAIARRYLSLELQALGHVLYNDEVPKSIKGQTPVMVGRRQGRTAREITRVAQMLLEPEFSGGGLLDRVKSRRNRGTKNRGTAR